jgi:alginate O-acetyltransferase complex protein AlgI
MLFQTTDFLYLIMAVLAGIIVLRTQTRQLVLILLASWYFYSAWDFPRWEQPSSWIPPILLLYCTVNDYLLGIAIGGAKSPAKRRAWLMISLVTNLGVLAIFKYANFFCESANNLLRWAGAEPMLPAVNIVLPIGISFYTFHSLGYNIDVYRGKTQAERSFLKFAIYVAYFPQLVAGPILRAKQFLPQLKGVINLTPSNLRSGSHLFLAGLFKKVVIADNIAPLADFVFKNSQGMPSLAIWVATFCFGVQIYCDFSGYTDMARGVSRLLGLEIPINFAWPYFATSITDFWRRWHISLSSWLRDYLYIPLGGNRQSEVKTYRNLMLTMALGGLWHGASWSFMIWGIYQGALLSIERLFGIGRSSGEKKSESLQTELLPAQPAVAAETPTGSMQFVSRPLSVALNAPWLRPVKWLLGWVVCQYFVFLGWLLFRNQDSATLLHCIRKYVLFDFNFSLSSLGLGNVNPFLVVLILMLFVFLHALSYRIGGIANRLDQMRGWRLRLVYAVSVAILIALWPQTETAFIYFQF